MAMTHFLPWVIVGLGLLTTIVLSQRRYERSPDNNTEASKFGYGRRRDNEEMAMKRRDQMASIIVAFLVLLSALFIILSGHYHETEQKWAYGAVGTIVGLLLRTRR
jgi:hypothetical protein